MKQREFSKKVGILGGSFDPIHMGHLNIAKSACEEFVLDEVWFIPAGHSPNKDETKMTAAVHRAKMTELAIKPYPNFRLSKIEMESTGTTYTYLTLTKLVELYPDTKFYFIMGADSLDYMEKWKHPEIIAQKAIILAAVRDDMDVKRIQEKIDLLQTLFEAEIYPVSGGKTDVSSTELRKQLYAEKNANLLLPKAVKEYIYKHKLYMPL